MAGTNLIGASSLAPKVLSSQQLPDALDHAVYTAPGTGAAIIRHAVCSNVSNAAVSLFVSVVPSGGTADGTHRVLGGSTGFVLAAGDDFTVDEIINCHLGPGDSIHVQASVGAAVNVILTGVEST